MSSIFQPELPPGPHQKLARYRQLSSRSSVHVSPLCLGGMSIGDQWSEMFGSMDKESSFKLLDTYYDAGGNWIDTANIYQEGSSEEFIGEWMEQRDIRSQMIIATKYTNIPGRTRGVPLAKQKVNFVGNNLKSMRVSLDISLKRLRTDYVDIFYVHAWDMHTSVEEIMDGLHNLVAAGKILYLGISNAPAWLVVKANDYARSTGKTPFVVYQAPYSILKRDIEREILPMCQHEGIALTLYFVLAAGHIRTTAEEEQRRTSGEQGRQGFFFGPWERTPDEVKVCDGLEKLAAEIGVKNINALAIAYVLHKAPYMFPIIGGRKVEHLHSNLEALEISLSKEQMDYLDNLKAFDKGYPSDALGDPSGYPRPVKMIATIDAIPVASVIRPVHD
ncbi:aryl-alcohol dehydrogenase [Lentinula edodes]|uniref:aryl-alcohol dehydrogenase n=1 Tax=Lentinula edodes TaxID=5353 RepID=UPI001E8CD8B4|nr:aryl-alcohol dehydrogenase [Lentinula edodes]KAH7869513.1 aryl-alcohol dehydrogenase [Lentinula edodes]KAJ3879403.1 aryl-alcohol dehydrogenase [Lentinula edodes]